MDWLSEQPTLLEIVPPPLRLGASAIEKRLAKVAAINNSVPIDAVNIPEIQDEESKSDGGDRQSQFEARVEPRELAQLIQKQLGIRCIINRVVVHDSVDEQKRWFSESYEQYGVRDFVLVGGEKSGVDYPGPSVPEANALVRDWLPGDVHIGNICIPTRNTPRRRECERMAYKAECGVDFFTTQIVYHAVHMTDLVAELQQEAIDVCAKPLFLSVCPVRKPQNFKFLRWLGVQIDEALEQELSADVDNVLPASIDHIVGMWRRVQQALTDSGAPTLLGLNIAPVGPIPTPSTIELARRLRAVQSR